MRIDPRWLLLLALAAAPAAAQPTPALTVTLTPPERLAVDDRAEVIATVTLSPPRSDGPILLTPISEGAAVEVVRGRLSRPDADDPAAAPLRFRIPIVAHTPGTAVLRVHALGYACRGPARRCRALETSTSVVLRVVAPGT